MAKGKRIEKSWIEEEIAEAAERREKDKQEGRRGMSADKKYAGARQLENLRSENHEIELAREIGAKVIDPEKVIDLKSRMPVAAGGIHSGPEIPKLEGNMPEAEPVENIKEIEASKEGSNTGETEQMKLAEAAEEVLNQASDKILAEIEAKIETDFSEAEKRFIDPMVGNYPQYFFEQKEKAEKKGVRINEKWIFGIRQFFIDERKRWGLGRQIAPEKAELLEKYLELKLPVGIPEGKAEVAQGNSERTKEKPVYTLVSPLKKGEFSEKRKFSDKQLENLRNLLEIAKESSGKVERSDLEKIVGELILEEFVPRKIFSKDKIPDAVEWVMKGIK